MHNDLNWSFLFFNSDDPPTHAAQGNWSWNCWMCLPLQFPAPCWMQHAFVIYLFECRYVRKFPQSPIFHKKGCFTHLLHPLLRLRLPVAPLLCLPAMFGRPQSHSPGQNCLSLLSCIPGLQIDIWQSWRLCSVPISVSAVFTLGLPNRVELGRIACDCPSDPRSRSWLTLGPLVPWLIAMVELSSGDSTRPWSQSDTMAKPWKYNVTL